MRKLPLVAAGLLSLSGWLYSVERPAPIGTAPAIDTTILRNYSWRSIGPDRGGRSIAVSGVRGRPNEGYFGATGGGLWKTTDGGENWTPVTDGQITSASIGAVAVSESNPDVVWIGTGETCIRGNIMPGDGVYKSTDAGKTWSFIGFRQADAIAKIRIHPRNPDIVYVASFGKYGGPSEDRGVFKTTDGGKTWRKVLYRDDKTGAVDISIDPTNPNVIYAALWEAYRTEWTMSSGGPGSGIFKSTDGGETWTELTRNPGMPSGLIGKIGIAVSPADPNRVYALVENENGGLFVSDDAGATWALTNSNRNIRQRAFYYTHVTADPKNRDQVYLLNVTAYRSTDGGKTINSMGGGTHGDYHDLWIDPDNQQHMLVANDGGGAVTTNGAQAWTAEDYPTPQIYRIFATTHQPFHVCGSQQDASSFCISTANPAAGGGRGGRGGGGGGGGGGGRGGAPAAPLIYNVGGSENGYIAQDPLDPDVFYVGTNANGGGFLNRVDRSTGMEREVSPYPRMFSGEESAVVKERWQWTYPIVFSRLNPRELYVGSQRLWVTRNGGQDWTALSGDLTRHDPKTMGPSGGPITRDMNGPEIYGVIFTIAPGKTNGQVIWTGSDDGLIHVTQNGGTTWANVTPKDMPDFGRVSIIDASNFNAGTAYAAVKRPLLNDRNPYIFRTRDFGRTWTKITNGIRQDDYVHTVREDPYQRGVLYAGTQQGVYVSYDDGDHWESLSLNLPMIPVSDLVVMPNDIAISTHGRGFYVLDNVNPLRRAGRAAAATGQAFLFAPAPAMRMTSGATIQYWLKSPAQGVRIEVMDTTGKVIRTFGAGTMAPPVDPNAQGGRGGGGGGRGGFGGANAPALTAGINTVTWDLRYPNAVGFPGLIAWGGGLTGPTAAPGRYRVKLTADNDTQTEDLVVVRNPLAGASDADLRAQFNLAIQIRDKVSEANNAVITIRDLKAQVADRLSNSQDANLKAAGDKLTADLSAVEGEIYQVKNQAGQDPLNYPIKINNRLMSLLTGVVNSGEGRPVGQVPQIFTDLKAELKVLTDKMDRVIATGVPAFNRAAQSAGVQPIVVKKPAPVM